ncbi:hypothetical protein GGS21DRAFT_465026 [Xylaria nigripes]|nr:hypothetical protein GGS21DRAFT_465026 [Xylaria nigripes]
MAGQPHYPITTDQAFQKLGSMSANRVKYFRWTPRTASITFVYFVVVPSIIGVIAYQTDGRFNFRAKRRGDLVCEY